MSKDNTNEGLVDIPDESSAQSKTELANTRSNGTRQNQFDDGTVMADCLAVTLGDYDPTYENARSVINETSQPFEQINEEMNE